MADDTTTAPAPSVVELNPDGTITLPEHDLRRPTIGQLRQLQAAWRDTAKQIVAASHKVREQGRELKERLAAAGDTGDVDAIIETRLDDMDAGTDFEQLQDTLILSWWCRVIDTLTGGSVDADTLPSALVDRGLPHRVVEHWRTVPSHSGSA